MTKLVKGCNVQLQNLCFLKTLAFSPACGQLMNICEHTCCSNLSAWKPLLCKLSCGFVQRLSVLQVRCNFVFMQPGVKASQLALVLDILGVTMTGKKKRHGEQLVTMDQEESPDMVDEILGRRTNTRQQKKETQNEEENCDNKHNQSGNTKQKCKMATADREGKKRVPPPPSARVDESRIDEEAVAKLEKARLERLREESDEKKENKDNADTANPKEEGEKGKAEQSQPLTPLVPREDAAQT